MANSFQKQVDIFFEDVVTGFDSANVSAKNVSLYKPEVGSLAIGGQTFYRPMPLMTEVVDGRDVSSSYKDLTELSVPSTLTESHIRNIPVQFTGVDLNNPHMYQRMVDAAKIQLSNKLDTMVANEIATKGSLVVTSTSAMDSYEELAIADAIMLEQQASMGQRCMFINPRMSVNVAGNLASRGTMTGAPMSAYERNMLPPVAGFDTFRVDYGKSITGSASTGVTVNGANQNTTPAAMSGDTPVDNRTQTLAVSISHGLVAGDAFTIAGVYSVGHINKQSTGQLKTFRVISVSGDNLTIAPAIIPADGSAQSQKDYANVTTTPASGAALTVLNTVTKPASVFFEKSAVEIIHADFNTDIFAETGKTVRKATTDSGVQIVMLSDSNVGTLVGTHRLFIWSNAQLLNYELGGILLEGQS